MGKHAQDKLIHVVIESVIHNKLKPQYLNEVMKIVTKSFKWIEYEG